ncbi:MAG TPA: TIGR01459 family HAD-type hydrolase [Aestuariivirga sp.]|nr:TIGR01459 family HAD-type hydrolase [Aestuariivirga sp.]
MHIKGLSEIAARFDGMLIDQFGVIHDGEKLYPGTLEVLENLQRLKIPVGVMTNSGKRSLANRERLLRLGVPRNLFINIISSGEVAYHMLGRKKAFLIGKAGEEYGFDGVPFVEDVAQAEVILILGSDAPNTSMAQYREFFSDTSLPAICCNPDKLMLTKQGLQPAPGAIAALYEEMGGEVRWIGKPYAEIYTHSLKVIGNPRSVLCIGDSAEHDVAGGRGVGLSTLQVMTGVSAGLNPAELYPQADYFADAFVW